jgi:bifunctional non-homologous end joining protein LigD
MISKFVVHVHKTGRTHYDLRLLLNDFLRCWSFLREPPTQKGERRLAVERETFRAADMNAPRFEEEAFGVGRVRAWDAGEVEICNYSDRNLILRFRGKKLSGDYSMQQMRWYPGNRWMVKKEAGGRQRAAGSQE